MARPRKCRRVAELPENLYFIPDGVENDVPVNMTVDEYESIRLIDYEGMTQEAAASQMNVARTTVTQIYDSARKKLAECLVNGRALYLNGGDYEVTRECPFFSNRGQRAKNALGSIQVPNLDNHPMKEKGENVMRLAITYDNGEIFQHFGHTEAFKVYDISDGKVNSSQVIDTNGQGHGALANFLFNGGVDMLICGGIGGGAINALEEAKIMVYPGISGNCDEAVELFLSGRLPHNVGANCSHHDHGEGHDCGSHNHGEGHSCGAGCGAHGCH